jgi:peptidylprolyl isomerase
VHVRGLALLLAALLALVACADAAGPGDGGDDDALPLEPTAGTEPADPSDEADSDAQGATVTDDTSGVTVEGDLDGKPQITLPGGQPPSELIIADIVEGDGEEVPEGATVTTHYVGVSWANDGEEFDASWNRGQPLTFPLSNVIQGWTQGIPGMRVGGRRLLVIPPDMGYGASSPTPAIAANDTLVFVIDLVDVD